MAYRSSDESGWGEIFDGWHLPGYRAASGWSPGGIRKTPSGPLLLPTSKRGPSLVATARRLRTSPGAKNPLSALRIALKSRPPWLSSSTPFPASDGPHGMRTVKSLPARNTSGRSSPLRSRITTPQVEAELSCYGFAVPRIHSKQRHRAITPKEEVFSPLPILSSRNPSRDPDAASGNWIPDPVGDDQLEEPSCARPFAGMQAMQPTRSTDATALAFATGIRFSADKTQHSAVRGDQAIVKRKRSKVGSTRFHSASVRSEGYREVIALASGQPANPPDWRHPPPPFSVPHYCPWSLVEVLLRPHDGVPIEYAAELLLGLSPWPVQDASSQRERLFKRCYQERAPKSSQRLKSRIGRRIRVIAPLLVRIRIEVAVALEGAWILAIRHIIP